MLLHSLDTVISDGAWNVPVINALLILKASRIRGETGKFGGKKVFLGKVHFLSPSSEIIF